MGKKLLHNPTFGEGLAVREVFVLSQEIQSRIDGLESALANEKNRVPSKEIVYQEIPVEKIVYQDDPALLNRFNIMAKENGELKKRIRGESPIVNKEPTVKVIREQYANKKHLLFAAIGGAITWQVFILLGKSIALFLK